MSFNIENENLLNEVYSVTEPGAAVRFLNRVAKNCKSKAELIGCVSEINEQLKAIENEIRIAGKNISCFYDLVEESLTRTAFFADEIVFGEDILKWRLNAEDSLLMAQAVAVQKWYDDIKPIAMPKRKALPEGFLLRLAGDADVPRLRVLVNRSYTELGAMGLNFVGVTQDEEITRDRMQGKEIWVIEDKATNELVATIALSVKETEEKNMFYIGQFGVLPERKKSGLGSFLIHHSFERAKARGYEIIELDTAIPAHHLVFIYRKFGFEIVEAERRPRPNYPNFLMDASVSLYYENMRAER